MEEEAQLKVRRYEGGSTDMEEEAQLKVRRYGRGSTVESGFNQNVLLVI